MDTDIDQLPFEGKVREGGGPMLCWSNLTKAQAEEVIDWLEANGHQEYDLDYDDSQGFCVRTSSPAGDRRASKRLPVSPEAVAIWLIARDGHRIPGRLRDISLEGIGVEVPRQHQPGEVVNVDLRHRTGRFVYKLVLTTTRSTPQANGSYLIGGTVSPRMPTADIRALVS